MLRGYDDKRPPDRRIKHAGVLFNTQQGLRIGRFDLLGSLGTDPASGLNLGPGVALALVD